jgi:hypothetical protein
MDLGDVSHRFWMESGEGDGKRVYWNFPLQVEKMLLHHCITVSDELNKALGGKKQR